MTDIQTLVGQLLVTNNPLQERAAAALVAQNRRIVELEAGLASRGSANLSHHKGVDEQVPGLTYPTTYQDLARISSVTLFNRWIGDRSPAAITAQEAFTAARAIPYATAPTQSDPMKLVQIRNVALEEAALIADGLDMHIVAAAIRERILTGVPAQTD